MAAGKLDKHYEIRHVKSGELTGIFARRAPAIQEAERLCNANKRKEHFVVVEMTDVYTTEPK